MIADDDPIYLKAEQALSESFPMNAAWIVKQVFTVLNITLVGTDDEDHPVYRIIGIENG